MKFKIGLAFSGGGFRASSFSLGVLSYLNNVQVKDSTLLNQVYALSTISGGTIAGTRYAMGIKNGQSFNEIYWSLYDFMSQVDLINVGLDNLVKGAETRPTSLITAFADAYDRNLFDQGKFGTLLEEDNPIHLKHISFNATEFSNALQFRFQTTEKIKNAPKGTPDKGIIGNYYYRIPDEIAKEIRMADILASSSCFPGGFEPISFPCDFKLPQQSYEHEFFNNKDFPVGLMDGGIVDNQGIEPLLLAEKRMSESRKKKKNKGNAFDLLIVSDVTSPYMKGFQPSKTRKPNIWRRLTFLRLIVVNLILLIAATIGLISAIGNASLTWSVICTSLITVNLLVYLLLLLIRKLPLKFDVPKAFLNPFRKLMKVKFAIYENMILDRATSLLKMTNDVFLKHIRRLNYDKIYTDESWKNRRIMNAIYELREEEDKLQRKIESGKLDKDLIPSKDLQQVASRASSMGTTLWFTKKELNDDNMLNSIIACGQFTMCWNLLEYIRTIKKDDANTNKRHKKLIKLEDQLLSHWKKFNDDPFWLVDGMER
ncbi:patatin-like phospholipase family protein [Puteibacter caeruleilacunae]|nr:patatin-like phospholipase family protein [Puteibacter caeruleilacunae]